MHNLGDDKELDRLSKEAAGKYTPPGQPNWEALSGELDKLMPADKKRRTVFFWWLLPVLLAGGASVYWFTKNDNTTTAALQTITTTPDTKPVLIEKKDNTDATVPARKNDRRISSTPVQALKEPASFSATGRNNKTTAAHDRKNRVSETEPVVALNPSFDQGVTGKKTDDLPASNAKPTEEAAQNNTAKITGQEQPVTENKTEPAAGIPAVDNQPVPQKSTAQIRPRGKGLGFGLLAGVDESTVKFRYGNTAGVNIGVMAGYHFNDRLSIHTGAIYTQKNYKVAGSDFTAPKGSWASYYKLETIEGYCRMWEVPLLMRYTISQSNRNSVFLSTGLSSYFMTKENYDYTYYNNAGMLTLRNTAYNSTDTHILSILHLSAGFENRISNTLSLQVEPYAKLPLGGVGLGNIRLSSFGLNFSVQYRQPAKK